MYLEVQLEALAEGHPARVVHLVELLPLSHELRPLQQLPTQVLLRHLDLLADRLQEVLQDAQVIPDVLLLRAQLPQLQFLLADLFSQLSVRVWSVARK